MIFRSSDERGNGIVMETNYRSEYWVSLRVNNKGDILIDGQMTYYSDSWSYQRREWYIQLADYIINGKTAQMYIIDWDEMGYDRCTKYAYQWLRGEFTVYRLD